MKLTIQKHHFEFVEKIAVKNNCSIQIISERNHPTIESVKLAEVEILANQPINHRILGYADKEGKLLEFTSDWKWSESEYANLDYSRCDKCGVKHFRNKIFVANVENKIVQIGGSCASNLNLENKVSKLVRSLEHAGKELSENDSLGYNSGSNHFVDINETLSTIAVVIKESGFQPANSDRPTKDVVSDILFNSHIELEPEFKAKVRNEIESTNWSSTCFHYLETQPFSAFKQTSQNALVNGNVKFLSFLCAVVHQVLKSERKALEATVARATRKQMVEGEKIEVQAKVTKIQVGESQYYHSPDPLQITLVDENYGKLWFQTTAGYAEMLRVGDTVKGNLKVKKVLDNIAFGTRAKLEIVQTA